MAEKMNFRQIELPNDKHAAKAVQLAFMLATGDKKIPVDQSMVDLAASTMPDYYHYGIDINDDLAAFGSMRPREITGVEFNLDVLVVDPAYRNRRIGSFLLNRMENEAYDLGARVMFLKPTDKSISLYRRHEYKEHRLTPKVLEMFKPLSGRTEQFL